MRLSFNPWHRGKKVENQGQIKGKIKTTANILAGTKLVQFYGDKGSYGEATYTGKQTITIEQNQNKKSSETNQQRNHALK